MAVPLGVVDIVYAPRPVPERAALAVEDGFEHIDVLVDVPPADLVLPVGCPIAFPRPLDRWCATPAPARRQGMWERAADTKIDGVLVHITMSPGHLEVIVTPGAEKALPEADRKKLFDILFAGLKDRKYEQGLTDGVKFVKDVLLA